MFVDSLTVAVFDSDSYSDCGPAAAMMPRLMKSSQDESFVVSPVAPLYTAGTRYRLVYQALSLSCCSFSAVALHRQSTPGSIDSVSWFAVTVDRHVEYPFLSMKSFGYSISLKLCNQLEEAVLDARNRSQVAAAVVVVLNRDLDLICCYYAATAVVSYYLLMYRCCSSSQHCNGLHECTFEYYTAVEVFCTSPSSRIPSPKCPIHWRGYLQLLHNAHLCRRSRTILLIQLWLPLIGIYVPLVNSARRTGTPYSEGQYSKQRSAARHFPDLNTWPVSQGSYTRICLVVFLNGIWSNARTRREMKTGLCPWSLDLQTDPHMCRLYQSKS